MNIRNLLALSSLFIGCADHSPILPSDAWDTSVGSPTEPDEWNESSAFCGNGVLEDEEECDDGNANNGDECLDNCVVASCGDGFVHEGKEECDDGNLLNGDACLSSCVFNECGDGFVNPEYEDCDDGNSADNDQCLVNCTFNICGDGHQLQTGPSAVLEACDDGNQTSFDGCSATCQREPFCHTITHANISFPACATGVSTFCSASDSIDDLAFSACSSCSGGTCTLVDPCNDSSLPPLAYQSDADNLYYWAGGSGSDCWFGGGSEGSITIGIGRFDVGSFLEP